VIAPLLYTQIQQLGQSGQKNKQRNGTSSHVIHCSHAMTLLKRIQSNPDSIQYNPARFDPVQDSNLTRTHTGCPSSRRDPDEMSAWRAEAANAPDTQRYALHQAHGWCAIERSGSRRVHISFYWALHPKIMLNEWSVLSAPPPPPTWALMQMEQPLASPHRWRLQAEGLLNRRPLAASGASVPARRRQPGWLQGQGPRLRGHH
jgi:hypothetical protein